MHRLLPHLQPTHYPPCLTPYPHQVNDLIANPHSADAAGGDISGLHAGLMGKRGGVGRGGGEGGVGRGGGEGGEEWGGGGWACCWHTDLPPMHQVLCAIARLSLTWWGYWEMH